MRTRRGSHLRALTHPCPWCKSRRRAHDGDTAILKPMGQRRRIASQDWQGLWVAVCRITGTAGRRVWLSSSWRVGSQRRCAPWWRSFDNGFAPGQMRLAGACSMRSWNIPYGRGTWVWGVPCPALYQLFLGRSHKLILLLWVDAPICPFSRLVVSPREFHKGRTEG